jgi:hypothetical protein
MWGEGRQVCPRISGSVFEAREATAKRLPWHKLKIRFIENCNLKTVQTSASRTGTVLSGIGSGH